MARAVYGYRVDFGGGERAVMSLLEPVWVDKHGLHPEVVLAVVHHDADLDEPGPADIRENPPFLRLLSRTIWESVVSCEAIRRQAHIQGNGFVYLLDERTSDPGGRVPPEDILGTVQVRDAQPVAGSYQHNPRHRLYTAAGWFQLPEEIETVLQRTVRSRTLR
ncbi:hypothetical protein [Actinoplanes sp. ATCC 53533]|uniref:hypothetical protein n=1 Tax=Actinoplanes sp. ATCC 53533 TaxID=1288362 RepID=UPI000F7BB199|nr:hypothetical protein [Actinoplanes sp. ATCC 53533]